MIKKMQATNEHLEMTIDGHHLFVDAALTFTRTVYGGDWHNESTHEDSDFEPELFEACAFDETGTEIEFDLTYELEVKIKDKIIEELQSEAEEV